MPETIASAPQHRLSPEARTALGKLPSVEAVHVMEDMLDLSLIHI